MIEMKLSNLEKHTKSYKYSLVPNVLPNNLKVYRELLRTMSVKQLSDDLLIDRNFLTAVESNDKNFSGKTTVRYMKHFGINFYTMYDVQRKVVTDAVGKDYYRADGTLVIDLNEIKSNCEDNMKMINATNDEVIDYLINKSGIIERQVKEKSRELASRIINEEEFTLDFILEEFSVLNVNIASTQINIGLNLLFKKSYLIKNHEFDINFAKNEDKELKRMLIRMGYAETIATLDYDIDGTNIKIIDNKVILDGEYKIPNSEKNFRDNFYLTNVLDIKKKEAGLEIKTDSEGNPIKARFRAIRPEVNNFKEFRTIARKDIDQMHHDIGLSKNGYVNLELGNQLISSKIMWSICKELKVPLELIVNINEYNIRFCKHKKIEKSVKSIGE